MGTCVIPCLDCRYHVRTEEVKYNTTDSTAVYSFLPYINNHSHPRSYRLCTLIQHFTLIHHLSRPFIHATLTHTELYAIPSQVAVQLRAKYIFYRLRLFIHTTVLLCTAHVGMCASSSLYKINSCYLFARVYTSLEYKIYCTLELPMHHIRVCTALCHRLFAKSRHTTSKISRILQTP